MLMYIHRDPGPFGWLIIAIFIVVGIIGAAKQKGEARQRIAELEALATRLSFDSFDPDPDYDFVTTWGFLDRFSEGSERYAFNILQGTYQDQKVVVFDYHYTTGSGKDRHDHYLTMLAFIMGHAFYKMTIQPENLMLKIEGAFDGESIKFESAEFSRAFAVRCGDKKFAYDVCNPQMMDYLLANRDLQVEIQGPLIVLAFKPQLPVGAIEFNLQRLAQIRALMPQYLFTNP